MAPVAEARIALVIGNGAYRDAPLKNPANDARAVAEVLRGCGFQVTELENATREQMFQALRDFGGRIMGGGVGLFYFAGHGMQVKGKNYLVPVGADIANEDEVAYNTLDADAVLAKMETARNRLNLLILDACRNNPFGRSFRSGSQGLAQMDAPAGSYIAFATAPGRTAADGSGSHGLYTQHLLANLKAPGLKVEDVFKRVRNAVMDDSKSQQVPWESSSLRGDFYFVPGVATTPAPLPAPVAQVHVSSRLSEPTAEEATLLEALRAHDGWVSDRNLGKDLASKGSPYAQFFSGLASDNPQLKHQAILRGVEQGIPLALVEQAKFLAKAPVSSEDLQEARNLLDRAMAQGEPHAKFVLGTLLILGKLGKQDVPTAERLFAEAARERPDYYHDIGYFFWCGNDVSGKALPMDDAGAKGLAYWRRAAELGDRSAMCMLAMAYRDGRNAPRDPDEGARWSKRAAELGDMPSMMDLGRFYSDPDGGRGDGAMAIHWYQRAAEKGAYPATLNMANLHVAGLLVPKDVPRALALLRPLAEQGIPSAQSRLGQIYQNEEPKDLPKACFWLTLGRIYNESKDFLEKLVPLVPKAERARIEAQAAVWRKARAERGDSLNQFCLGELYEHGVGLPKDLSQAYFWYMLAGGRSGDLGYPEHGATPPAQDQFQAFLWHECEMNAGGGLKESRERIAGLLPPAERARIEAQAARWKPKP